jgi:hypothetical protein
MGYTTKQDLRAPEQRQRESGHALSDPTALARLFDEWMQGDEAEQRETFETLRHSLDEGRRDGHKLFPQA